MKKVIVFDMNTDSYIVLCENKKITEVKKNGLHLKGKEIYDNFFSSISFDEEIELEFNDEKIESKEDKRICDEIKDIFKMITERINQELVNKVEK